MTSNKSDEEMARLAVFAKAASVSRRALYLHFDARVDLIIATAEHVDESTGITTRMQMATQNEKTLNGLERVSYILSIYKLAKFFLATRDHDEAGAAALENRMTARRLPLHRRPIIATG